MKEFMRNRISCILGIAMMMACTDNIVPEKISVAAQLIPDETIAVNSVFA